MSLLDKMNQHGLVPLFYHDDPKVCEKVLDIIRKNDLKILEFTNRGPKAVENFGHLVKYLGDNRQMSLGVGSVKSGEDAKQFIDLGARFIVSPYIDKSTADACRINGIPWIPGCGTLTEIITAEKMGAELVKLFPGGVYGPKFISSVLAPCPWLKIMPTGGVTGELENLSVWFTAGAYCVGMGSKLIAKEYLENNDFAGLSKHIVQVMKNIEKARFSA